MSNEEKMLVSDYIDNEYRAYSMHTITRRGIPLIVDGLKPVQRKILYTATKECANRLVKVSTLAGALPKVGGYHHGSGPAEQAIVQMAQTFNNNIVLLEGKGTFGSRPVPTAAAARYISVRMAESYDYIFKDNEVLPWSLDKEDHPEPICFLPLIPFYLVNGAAGIAVAVATKILSRSPKDLAKACKQYLTTGKIKTSIDPVVDGFRGTFEHEGNNKYLVKGTWNKNSSGTILTITEIPLGFSHEQYVAHLDKLKASQNSPIISYADDTENYFEFKVKLSKEGKTLTDEKIEKVFKLNTSITENLTLVVFEDMTVIPDDHTISKVKTYDNVIDSLKDFVDFRLIFFGERIKYNIARCTDEIEDNTVRIDFISRVLDGRFAIKDRTRKEMIDELESLYTVKYSEKLIAIQVSAMSSDNIDRMTKKIAELEADLIYWQSCKPEELYVQDLDTLIKKLK